MRLLNSPPPPPLNVRLYHGKIPKVVSPRFTTLNWQRGDDDDCSVSVHQLSNSGWIGLKFMSKIVVTDRGHLQHAEFVRQGFLCR